MSIFQDIHTYLIISFLLMGILLFKLAYRRVDAILTKNADDIRSLIDNLEIKKTETETQLLKLKKDLKNANASIEKAVLVAEKEAQKITEKSSERIKDIVLKKQKEHKTAIEKIHSGFSIELQNKIISLALNNLGKKLQDAQTDRDIQNKNIDVSIKMLEDFVDLHT